MKKQKNGLTLNEAKPNCFEKTKVRRGIFKIFSSQNYNRSTNVVLAANVKNKYSMNRILEQIIDRNTEGNYLLSSSDKEQMVSEILDLFGVIGRLSFKEIEMLVQLKHYDDSDYGNNEKRCSELIEATRNKVGYTKDDVKAYL